MRARNTWCWLGAVAVAVSVLAALAATGCDRPVTDSPSPPQVSDSLPAEMPLAAPAEIPPAVIPDDAKTQPAEPPKFTSEIISIPPEVRQEMLGRSWQEGCPVPIEDLRLVSLSHWSFDGKIHRGELVVHHEAARDILEIFEEIFEAGFPIVSLRRVDAFNGSDDVSMRANNSSGFNCRRRTTGRSFSRHAYGMAVDINPLQNPWVWGEDARPPEGAAHRTRDAAVMGLIVPDGPVVRAFSKRGWTWGGRWRRVKDYQHFERRGPAGRGAPQ